MKIQAIKNYSIYQKTLNNTSKPSERTFSQGQSAKISFGNSVQYEILGIAEPLFDSILKNVVSEKEINNIKVNLLTKDKKYSPSLAYIFIQTFNLGAKKRKEDSPGISIENKNNFAIDYASNVFYALKDIKNEYDFSNFQESLGIIYQVQKSNKIEDLFSFLFCCKDEKTEKFMPEVAKTMFQIITQTGFQSPIDIKFYIEDYCRDIDGEIDEDNVEKLIEFMGVVGNNHIDSYKEYIFNSQTKEFLDEPMEAIRTMLDYFLSDECKNKDYKMFTRDVAIFICIMLKVCNDPDTNSLNKDFFDSYFLDIQSFAHDDFQKMFKMLLRPEDEE